MTWVLAFFTLTGVNVTIWAFIGLLRFVSERFPNVIQRKTFEDSSDSPFANILVLDIAIALLGFVVIAEGIVAVMSYLGEVPVPLQSFAESQQFATSLVINLFLWLFLATLGGYINTAFLGILFVFYLLLFSQNAIQEAFVLGASFLAVLSSDYIRKSAIKRKEYEVLITTNPEKPWRIAPREVAAIIPAHNEEVSLARTIKALKKIFPQQNIYIGSDASTDQTLEIARAHAVHAVDIQPNRGKAGVLLYLIGYYRLLDRYKAIMIVDADSEIDEHYLERALPLFEDPEVVAVAGHAVSKWKEHWPPKWSMFFTAYRVRLYRVLQAIMRYGQTWKYTNVTSIVPGFASIYRTSVLSRIYITAPGLIIEDFNMTFELYHKKLGKVAYTPRAFGIAQDPHTLFDYMNQVKRWNLGLWQTVRRHGFWPSLFWASLGPFLIEMLLYSIFLVFLPFLFLWFFLNSFQPFPLPFLDIQLRFIDLIIGVFVIDYLLTCLIAFIEKKPILLLYGFGFIILRFVDTVLFLYTLPLAFLIKSEGKWASPERE